MNTRTTSIANKLGRWLERYTPPLFMTDKPQAKQGEAEALFGCLCRYAPQMDYDPWIDRALETCSEQMKTRAWPTLHELATVCRNLLKETASPIRHDTSGQENLDLIARIIRSNLSAGEHWIFGRIAVKLVRSGRLPSSARRRQSPWTERTISS